VGQGKAKPAGSNARNALGGLLLCEQCLLLVLHPPTPTPAPCCMATNPPPPPALTLAAPGVGDISACGQHLDQCEGHVLMVRPLDRHHREQQRRQGAHPRQAGARHIHGTAGEHPACVCPCVCVCVCVCVCGWVGVGGW
jgi:hypothetical protein